MKKKKCTKCGETKQIDRFHKDPYSKKGLHSQCKDCQNTYIRERRHNDPDFRVQDNAKKLERHLKRYQNDPEFRAKDFAKNAKRNREIRESAMFVKRLTLCMILKDSIST